MATITYKGKLYRPMVKRDARICKRILVISTFPGDPEYLHCMIVRVNNGVGIQFRFLKKINVFDDDSFTVSGTWSKDHMSYNYKSVLGSYTEKFYVKVKKRRWLKWIRLSGLY